MLNDNVTVDFIDLNCGCPIDILTSKGMGSAILDNKSIHLAFKLKSGRFKSVVSAASSISDVPFTIKIRTGKDEKNPFVHKFVPEFKSWGAAAVTVYKIFKIFSDIYLIKFYFRKELLSS